MKRFVATIMISSCMLLAVHAQSPVFSQYYASATYLNPALTGLERDVYVGMNYRMQWSNVNMPFSTFQFTFIHPIMREGLHSKHLGGVGLSFLNDVAGQNQEFVTRSILMSAAYNFHMNRYGNNIISIALQGGCTQQRFNDNQLQWSSQYSSLIGYDNTLPGESGTINNQVINPTINAGLMWHLTSKDRYARKKTSVFHGIAAANINRVSGFFMSPAPSGMILKAHGGISIVENKVFEFSPNYLVQYQNHLYQINIGAYAGYAVHGTSSKVTKVTAGIWYRMQDAFIVSTGFCSSTLTFGFSYDTNVSSLSRSFGNATAYEFSLAYRAAKNKSFKRFSSPLI